MEKYEPRVLRKLQLTELEILKDFDAICRKHDIPYVVFYGAGIGVLRHGGFIPWDDDIDLLILRSDYERFLKIAELEAGSKYCLINAELDSNFPAMVTSFGLKGTKFVSDNFKSTKESAICIDLLPLDNTSDDQIAATQQSREAWFWNKLMILRQLATPNVPFKGSKRKFVHFLCKMLHLGLKILNISPKWLYKQCKKVCLRYEGAKTKDVSFLTGTYPGENIFSKDELFPPRYLEFEGVKLPFPNKIETLLTRHYGDYMQLPPEEERRNHFPAVLDFGDGERYENDS